MKNEIFNREITQLTVREDSYNRLVRPKIIERVVTPLSGEIIQFLRTEP